MYIKAINIISIWPGQITGKKQGIFYFAVAQKQKGESKTTKAFYTLCKWRL
jgi:hypothetical protein